MNYSCPYCRTTNRIHAEDCRFSGIDIHTIEKAHTDILSILTRAPQTLPDLRENVHGDWGEVHAAVFDTKFVDGDRLDKLGEVDQGETSRPVYKLKTPDEIKSQQKHPSHPSLETIYENGAVDGCLDNALISLIGYWEMIDINWDETRELALDWLDRTGTWERGSFEESSPEELVESKKHVHEEGYGWKQSAQAAASHIEDSGITQRNVATDGGDR